MSRLLQALLGANVDGSGSSFHVDRRASRDRRDNFTPFMIGTEGPCESKEARNCAKTVVTAAGRHLTSIVAFY